MPGVVQSHIAAVTGAGSGIGRAIALGFAREGATVDALGIDSATAAKTFAGIRGGAGGQSAREKGRHAGRLTAMSDRELEDIGVGRSDLDAIVGVSAASTRGTGRMFGGFSRAH
jgi:NAD(P)-dependent dehydrogenase (short-subunit alcohol dehydrogenase family)